MKTFQAKFSSRARSVSVIPRVTRWVLCAAVLATVAACGSGSEREESTETTYAAPASDLPTSRNEAARFLTQASFGPTDASIDRVMALGYSGWIDEQLSKPVASHRAAWDRVEVVAQAASTASAPRAAGKNGVINSFWRSAVTGEDQLRQRVAYALSQIFVISMQSDAVANDSRATASYLDMLTAKGLGSYRQLLEAVSLHPQMGRYLTSLGNLKENAGTGRVPDENYAREVMQLFSIGLFELNDDGSRRLVGGAPVETYTAADISGLARVFTGWSWACPVAPTGNDATSLASTTCFATGSVTFEGRAAQSYPDRSMRPMIGYPVYHEPGAKTFLGVTIPAQSMPNPNESLRIALDRLASHPNVGPFIGRQLIQRLVTSNPSPAYVRSVTAVFRRTQGDMAAVVRAILMHEEARTASATGGKVREPVLRLSAYLRAFPFTSVSGYYLVGFTDDPGDSLGQTPLHARSVFNFYRPGYVPPGSNAAAANLVGPELELVDETSVAWYANYMRDGVSLGVGTTTSPYTGVALGQRDMQPSFTAELALVAKPTAAAPTELIEQINRKLMYGTMPAALKTEIQTAVASIAIPVLNSGGTTQADIDTAKRKRVNAAVFLTLVSPEFQVQK